MSEDPHSEEAIEAHAADAGGQAAVPDPSADSRGVRQYSLSSQERIVRGRMPTLEIVNERFAGNLGTGIFNFMRRHPGIVVGAVKVQKFSAFLNTVSLPANINVMHVRPLRGCGLLICDPKLIYTIVENLFGGAGRNPARIEEREFSATEQRIIVRLVEVMANAYAKSWSAIYPLKLEYARSEMHPQFANVATPSEMVVTTTFCVELGGTVGDVHLCIPYATLEPIREILYSPMQGDQSQPDGRWVSVLTQEIKSATVELAAELAYSHATVRELLALKVGDFIELDRGSTLTTKVDGVPVFECEYGTLGTRYGVRIREFLTQPGPGTAAPGAT